MVNIMNVAIESRENCRLGGAEAGLLLSLTSSENSKGYGNMTNTTRRATATGPKLSKMPSILHRITRLVLTSNGMTARSNGAETSSVTLTLCVPECRPDVIVNSVNTMENGLVKL